MRVEIEGGKYTYVFHPDGRSEVLRYGEPWRDCVGDKFTYCMAAEIEELREENKELLKALEACEQHSNELFQETGEDEYREASDNARTVIDKVKGRAA